MKTKILLLGILLCLHSGANADDDCCPEHPFCGAEYFFKQGDFFFERCGHYFPVYQYRWFNKLISQEDRYREWKVWYHEYPNDKLACCFYPAKGHYRMHTREGLSVEHYFE
jgi:hypothetical protein